MNFSSSSINLLNELNQDLSLELEEKRKKILTDIDNHLSKLDLLDNTQIFEQESIVEASTSPDNSLTSSLPVNHHIPLMDLPQDVNSKGIFFILDISSLVFNSFINSFIN